MDRAAPDTMTARANLCASVGAIIALLGCAPEVVSPVEPEPAPEARECLIGDEPVCTDLIDYYDAIGEPERADELVLGGCTAGDLALCSRLARDELEAGAARERFAWLCARGHEWSCAWLVQTDAQAVVEQKLNQHAGLWRCARLAEHAYFESSVTISGALETHARARDVTKLWIDPMPGHAILQACVRRALASTTFATTAPSFGVSYELDLRSEVVAAKLAELAPDGGGTELPGPCPPEVAERCEPVAIDAIMDNGIHAPDASAKDLTMGQRVEEVPGLVTIAFCVDPKNGSTNRIRASHSIQAQPVVMRLVQQVAKWRFYPIEVGGEPTLACSRVEFDVGWINGREKSAMSAFLPPLHFVPARGIYTPMPSPEALRAITPGAKYTAWIQLSICINRRGRVVAVRNRSRHWRHLDLEWILHDTVKTWRFVPMRLDGRPHESCIVRTFRIRLR